MFKLGKFLFCVSTIPCAYLCLSISHTHTRRNDLFTFTASLMLCKLSEVMDPGLLPQADSVPSRHPWMLEEWMKGSKLAQSQRSKGDLTLIPLSLRVSVPHILPGHCGFRAAELHWIYRGACGFRTSGQIYQSIAEETTLFVIPFYQSTVIFLFQPFIRVPPPWVELYMRISVPIFCFNLPHVFVS